MVTAQLCRVCTPTQTQTPACIPAAGGVQQFFTGELYVHVHQLKLPAEELLGPALTCRRTRRKRIPRDGNKCRKLILTLLVQKMPGFPLWWHLTWARLGVYMYKFVLKTNIATAECEQGKARLKAEAGNKCTRKCVTTGECVRCSGEPVSPGWTAACLGSRSPYCSVTLLYSDLLPKLCKKSMPL